MRLFWLFLFIFSSLCSCQKENSHPIYRIARDPSWYPLNLMGKANAIDGFSTDLMKAIALEEELPIDWVSSEWNLLLTQLKNGIYDGVLSSLQPSDITLSSYSFSDPYLLLGPVLVVPINSQVQSLNDLEQRTIGVVGSTQDVLIAQKIHNVVVRNYERPAFLLEDLALGKIDGALLAILEAHSFIKDLYHGTLKIISEPLNDQGLRLITLKNQDSLLISSFNAGLANAKKEKTYETLLYKWNLN